ncbi:hypothetical protein PIB30_047472 [Stylosanthes scabra]|uniref:Uncharacterized protein n=1 Tax=Stylosanthes scabra TaxID=79078 RepID=A0ABU6ZFI5_9FABA|nr:hypothetical protein [Stylosanthes scabra]
MKSIEPRLTAVDQWENRCAKLNGDLKMLNLQKIEAEKERAEAEHAKLKAEGDLKSASDSLKTLEKERDMDIERRKDMEAELDQEICDLRKLASDEKAHADKAEASLAKSETGREELVQMAQDSVTTTERALKAQISLLLPDFNVSQLGALKLLFTLAHESLSSFYLALLVQDSISPAKRWRSLAREEEPKGYIG